MNYDFIGVPDQDVPPAQDPLFQHLVATYPSETYKTASMWRVIPDDLLEFKPHAKFNTIRAILVHHRTQIQTRQRLAGQHVPAIYGPSGDVKWDEADPTYPLEAAKRGG